MNFSLFLLVCLGEWLMIICTRDVVHKSSRCHSRRHSSRRLFKANEIEDMESFNKKLERHFATTDSITADEWMKALPTREEIHEIKSLIGLLFTYDTFENFEPFVVLSAFPQLLPYVEITIISTDYCVVHEKLQNRYYSTLFPRFWGYVAIASKRHASRANLHHSAAHFQTDGEVCAQAAAIFRRTRSRSLVVAGASRYAVHGKTESTCQRHTALADAAHNNATMFHAMNLAIFEVSRQHNFDEDTFIQWHGMASITCGDIVVFGSAGVNGSNTVYAREFSPINRIIDTLNNALGGSYAGTPATAHCRLKATTNVFGRVINGVPVTEACTKSIDKIVRFHCIRVGAVRRESVLGQFVHLEQKSWIGNDWDLWTRVIKSAFSIQHESTNEAEFECHSCLRSCETTADGKLDAAVCDCISEDLAHLSQDFSSSTCSGGHCFAKIEFFPDESIVIIQKGCIDGLVKGLSGCHYAGQPESVHCYCQGHLCNNKNDLNSYLPKPLPTVECCECSQPSGDLCPKENCLRTCRGNYCLVDFDGVEQGCGLGVPRLQSFLRIPDYLAALQGTTTCAKYQATFSTSVHGCVCTKPTGMCNALETMMHYQVESVIKRRIDDQNYCYSLHQRDYEKPLEEGVFNKSETCEGHYCFIVLTTSELAVEVRIGASNSSTNSLAKRFYTGKSSTRFEILAGCLKVDDDKKVSLGCTTEYTSDGGVLSRHCICDSHLCNYYSLVGRDASPAGVQLTLASHEENRQLAKGIMHDAADDNAPPPSLHARPQSMRNGVAYEARYRTSMTTFLTISSLATLMILCL